MSKGNLAACLAVTLEFEGGYVDHEDDPGGATNMGITRKTLARWRGVTPWSNLPKSEVKALTRHEAERIYEKGFWRPVRGDELPAGVDLATFDFCVNSGISRAAKTLQAVVGAATDGQIGTEDTLPKVHAAEPRKVIKGICARRLRFVQGLKIWSTFGKGWSRRIAAVEAKALSWVSTKGQLQADAKEASGKAVGQGVGAGGAIAAGATDQAQGLTGLPIGVVVVAVVIVGAILIIRVVINAQRATALSQAAKEA